MDSKDTRLLRSERNGAIYSPEFNGSADNATVLSLFQYQYETNDLYRAFAEAVGKNSDKVKRVEDIPFLPVAFFKTHPVRSGEWQTPELIFESSRTTGDQPSRHDVRDAVLYEKALLQGFREFYGDPSEWTMLALLPSYLERSNASLVHMAQVLMRHSGHPANGFFLDDESGLLDTLAKQEAVGNKTLLLGVTFALLDMAAKVQLRLRHTTVMETGGMKGRRQEWTRAQVHHFLKRHLGVETVHAEYGMTELLSQAYSGGEGVFHPASTMRVLVREPQDPLSVSQQGTGLLNIVDTANIHSCAFIATDDIGTIHPDGSFEVLGRADHAALRGCSLMTA